MTQLAPGVADDGHPPAGRTPLLEIELRRPDQLVHVLRAPDAVLAEERVDDAILVGQRAGVRSRGRLSAHRAAGLDRDDRHVALAGDGGGPRQRRGIADALDVQQQQPHGRVVHDRQRQLRQADVGVVAGRMRVPHADARGAAAVRTARRSSCRSG